MVRHFVLLSGIVLALGICQAVGSEVTQLKYPRSCPGGCGPHSEGYGYFRTMWRQWPGESRPEITNSIGINREVLPTPQGQEQLPLPQPAATPRSTAPEGGILPQPEGTILPPLMPPLMPPSLLEGPAEPKGEKSPKSSLEGGLPGLPAEPGESVIPSPPEGEKVPAPPSGLNPPSTPAPPTPTKPAEDTKSPAPPSGLNPPSTPAPTVPTKPAEDTESKEKPPAKEESNPRQPSTLKDAPTSPKLPTSPVSPKAGKPSLSEARPAKTEQATTMAVVVVDEAPGTVISLVEEQEPAQNEPSPDVGRADSIAAATPESSDNGIEAVAYAAAESTAPAESTEAEVVVPPLALNGYCPVELTRNGAWTRGDLRWTVVHKGWIYRLSGPEQRQQFLAKPEAFTPAFSGNDAVLAADEHRTAAGRVEYCATYNGRLYMFSSAATQSQFNKDPQRYAAGK